MSKGIVEHFKQLIVMLCAKFFDFHGCLPLSNTKFASRSPDTIIPTVTLIVKQLLVEDKILFNYKLFFFTKRFHFAKAAAKNKTAITRADIHTSMVCHKGSFSTA